MSENHFFDNLRSVITLVDNLRDIGLQNYFSLPRIVVLGTQSAGKSSLLEQIVGLDFLPRGSGVVTRRPLELRLVYKSPQELSQPYAVFEEVKGQQFTDFNKVREMINIVTDKVAGTSKDIIDKPIILHIYSSSCPDLTLVDLPGITRIPLPGQSQNIEEITKNMAKRYIEDEQTIILAVSPANADISTSESLMMAKKMDPKGERTLGVITKIDIMDRGVDAKSMILGKDIPLKLGYVGIVGRSQQDIKDNKPVKEHLKDEIKYFSTHPVYATLPAGTLGTNSLTNRLTEILYRHIRKYMPELIKKVKDMVKIKQVRLDQLGPGMPDTDQEKLKYLWSVVTQFAILFKTSLQGTYSKNNLLKGETPAGSEIRIILQELYKDQSESECCSKYQDKDIAMAIQLHEAGAIPGFPSMDSFLALLIPQIRAMREPAQEMISEIYNILEKLSKLILSKLCEKIPDIRIVLEEQIIDVLQQEREKTREVINDIIDTEINYVFTQDINSILERKKKFQQDDRNNRDIMVVELRQKIDDYWSIIVRGLRDTVPKLIGHFLVNGSQSQMKNVLFEVTSKSRELNEKLKEPIHIVEERKELKNYIAVMQKSIDIIRKDPEMSSLLNVMQEEDNVEIDYNSRIVQEELRKQKQNQMEERSKKYIEKTGFGIEEEDNEDDQSQYSKKESKKSVYSQNSDQEQKQKNIEKQQPNQVPQAQAQPNKNQQSNLFPSTQNSNNLNKSQVQKPQQQSGNQNLFPPTTKLAQNTVQNQPSQPTTQLQWGQYENPEQKKDKVPANNTNLFGDSSKQNQTQVKQNQNSNSNSNSNSNNLFGTNIDPKIPNKIPVNEGIQKESSSEKNQNKTNDLFGQVIDKGVDKVTNNDKFKNATGQAANQIVSQAVDSQIPIKGADGKNPVAEQAGKLAEKKVQDPKVQQQINQQMKDNLKDQAGMSAEDKKKQGGFKFW